MRNSTLYALIIVLLHGVIAAGTDLCLLKIDSQKDFDVVSQQVEYAHGLIDRKFIVFLDGDRFQRLQSEGIAIELLAPGCQPEKIYLLTGEHNRDIRSNVVLSPLYSTPYRQIVALESSSVAVLEKEGYRAFSLMERNTPFFYNPPAYATPLPENYETDSIADLIDPDSLYNYVLRMENFWTRFTPAESCIVARDWLLDKFSGFGYDYVYLQAFMATREWMDVINEPAWNVICLKEGSVYPDKWIILGAHYDSYVSNYVTVAAPGADDNASGTAGVLEIARAFSNIDNKKSLMFVAFGAEEQLMDGSEVLAEHLSSNDFDIEFMLNLDVIAYENDSVHEFRMNISHEPLYVDIFVDAAERLTDLLPYPVADAALGDEEPFYYRGYNSTTPFEWIYNPYMHSNRDRITRIDLDYMRQIIQMSAASVMIIDHAPYPMDFWYNDFGDGQSIRVGWDSDCETCMCTIVKGTWPTFLDDTVIVPATSGYLDVEGLVEDLTYYLGVYQSYSGVPQLTYSLIEVSSLVVPRPPTGLVAEPDTVSIKLSWKANIEYDIEYYQLFKKAGENDWQIMADNHEDTFFVDEDVVGQVEYSYRLCAVDLDGHISDSSEIVSCILASFDAGVLIVDETQSGGINPGDGAQSGFFRLMMGDIPYATCFIDSPEDQLGHAIMGQYNPLFWVDDDDFNHIWYLFEDTLRWYFEYGNDFLFAGWNSIFDYTDNTYFYPGSFLYDEFGISYVGSNILGRFVGASGEDDWPDLFVKPDAPNDGHLPNIQAFNPAAGAEVIYRFETDPYHSGYQDKPVGIAYDTYNGKRVILGFPLYWLTLESAQALVNRVLEYFAAPSIPPPPPPPGDVNGDMEVNILDATYLIQYLYRFGPEPPDLNNSDPNGDCDINILDITYLISYLYKGGPEPVEGCVY